MTAVHSNGLPAASYAALVDVDPPLVDHVLEILRDAGIGAYAEPIAGETGPYREVRAPDRPTTRVYVDRGRLAAAREAIESRLPALRADFLADAAARADAASMAAASADDVDAAWEQIVSGFGDTAPDREVPPLAGETPESPEPGSGLSARLVRQHAAGPRDYEVAEDPDDDRFVPPPPPPLPRPRDRFDLLAWMGTIGGPILLMVSYVTGVGGWLAGAGFAAFTAGFVTLIVRAGERRRDDGDHGAVV
ncbi:MAG: hypothetical protein ACKOT0_04600 [bacterium]